MFFLFLKPKQFFLLILPSYKITDFSDKVDVRLVIRRLEGTAAFNFFLWNRSKITKVNPYSGVLRTGMLWSCAESLTYQCCLSPFTEDLERRGERDMKNTESREERGM